MAHPRRLLFFGLVSALGLVLIVGPAWALPTHEFHGGWGKGGSYNDYDAGKHHKNGTDDKHHKNDYEKWHPDAKKLSFLDSRWHHLDKDWWGGLKKLKDHDGHGFKKWSKGHDKYDPDCDPPVSTPEPGTLLLLGSTLAGVVYARRRRQPAGEQLQG